MCGALPSCLTPFVEVARLPHCDSYVLKEVVFLPLFRSSVVRRVKIARLEFNFCLLLVLGMHGALFPHPTLRLHGVPLICH